MNLRALATVASLGVLGVLSACGGGGDSNKTFIAANAQTASVGPGPTNNVNLLFVTVDICTPGTSDCQSIDHVLVDTGSTGLRILSSLVSPSLLLRQQTDANGRPLVECGQFVNGFTWGPVKIADVRISQELARSTPIQLMGDPAFPSVPSSCSNIGGSPLGSAQALGANGVLGVSMFQQDCGAVCAQNVVPGTYYACPLSGCQSTQAGLAQQLQNPVGMFALNNNGIVIDLPAVPLAGTTGVNGSLIFGIGTQGNNALGNAQPLRVNATSGTFTTILNGVSYSNSFVDSGSNALYFPSATIPVCNANSDFYCPPATLNLAATMRGNAGTASSINFRVANAVSMFSANPSFFAFSALAGPNSDPNTFDWGLPFFYGRKVFIAIEGRETPAGVGPYLAF